MHSYFSKIRCLSAGSMGGVKLSQRFSPRFRPVEALEPSLGNRGQNAATTGIRPLISGKVVKISMF